MPAVKKLLFRLQELSQIKRNVYVEYAYNNKRNKRAGYATTRKYNNTVLN